jgi:hypothetical protein
MGIFISTRRTLVKARRKSPAIKKFVAEWLFYCIREIDLASEYLPGSKIDGIVVENHATTIRSRFYVKTNTLSFPKVHSSEKVSDGIGTEIHFVGNALHAPIGQRILQLA